MASMMPTNYGKSVGSVEAEVYARVIAQKCRAASSLLRDIYLGDTRPWAVKPPSAPKIPDEIQKNIDAIARFRAANAHPTARQAA